MSTLVVRSRKIQFFKISYKNTTYKAVGGGGGETEGLGANILFS